MKKFSSLGIQLHNDKMDTEEWNKDDLCLDDKEKSREILLEKLLDLKKQNKTVIIRNLDKSYRRLIDNTSKKEGFELRAINRKNNIIDLEIKLREIQIKKPHWRKTWRGECNECGTELTITQALFNVHIRGPFCEECVENDEELSAHKWEKNCP